MFISLNRYQNPEEMILCHIKLHRVQKDHHHNILHFTHSLVRESISDTPECNQSTVCKTKENNQHGFVKCSHYLTILHRIVCFRFSVNYETLDLGILYPEYNTHYAQCWASINIKLHTSVTTRVSRMWIDQSLALTYFFSDMNLMHFPKNFLLRE